MKLTYQERVNLTTNPLNKKLFQLIEEKNTNLVLAADLSETKKLFEAIEGAGPHIAVLKTHIDILDDFELKLIEKIVTLSQKHNFMIFEDRKFADIGNTVKKQYSGGIYKIVDWADMTNCHIIPGPGIIKGLREVVQEKNLIRGLILLGQMTSDGNLATDQYTQEAVKMAKEYPDFVSGFIGNGGDPIELKKLSSQIGPEFIIMTPGVNLETKTDQLGQRYSQPDEVIAAGADCIIVGRGIYQAEDPAKKAKEYQEKAWSYYQKVIGKL